MNVYHPTFHSYIQTNKEIYQRHLYTLKSSKSSTLLKNFQKATLTNLDVYEENEMVSQTENAPLYIYTTLKTIHYYFTSERG